MADREKDFSHNGTFNPNYPSPNKNSDDATHTGTLNPNYPGARGGGNGDSTAYHLGNDVSSDTALRRIRTAGSISISPELFEKIYLSPQNSVKGDLRKTFGNPTPLALAGFLLSLTPLCCDLMGWRGAGGNGAADVGAYFFMGGLLMIIGGVLEFFLGNTFPFVVFCSFGQSSEYMNPDMSVVPGLTALGGFWLTFASTLTPFYNAYGAYSPDPSKPAEGLNSPAFAASFGFFQLFMGLLCFVYLICALRTNIVFLVIFATLVVAFSLLAGTYWHLAMGNHALGAKLQVIAGGFLFVTCMAGWWIFLAQMLAAVDFPLQIPVGDISHLIPGASTKMAAKEEEYSA